ncbi:MAG: crossover junction endodeoxyribonuclease RuvC [Candidatus Protochlamydia sp.]|nr:crossover junction endodeoxyribonuclease RuvC [Candidatus Protochlamydia sp.]
MGEKRLILGVDPGTRVTGYGIIALENHGYIPIDFGCIRPPASHKLSDKYLVIFESVVQLIEIHAPSAVVVETQYVHKNVQSAIKLGMARGAVMIAAKKKGIPVFEYAPTKAKIAVVGTGRASKVQVQGMVQRLLNLAKLPEPEDAADALALAICHAQMPEFKVMNYEI